MKKLPITLRSILGKFWSFLYSDPVLSFNVSSKIQENYYDGYFPHIVAAYSNYFMTEVSIIKKPVH